MAGLQPHDVTVYMVKINTDLFNLKQIQIDKQIVLYFCSPREVYQKTESYYRTARIRSNTYTESRTIMMLYSQKCIYTTVKCWLVIIHPWSSMHL